MKFLVAKLDQYGASVVPPDRHSPLTVKTRSGLIVPIDPCPDPCEPDSTTSLARLNLPRWSVDASVDALVQLDHERNVLRDDRDLTQERKRKEFVAACREYGADRDKPGPLPKALRAITSAYSDFAEHERVMRMTEAERYVVPPLQAQNFGEALRDFRIWTNNTAHASGERGPLIQRIGKGEDVNLLLATLRDPCAWKMPDLEVVATTAWRELRDRTDPAGRAALDLQLATIEWAKRSINLVAGNMRRLLSVDDEPLDRGQVYQFLRDEQRAAGKLSAAATLFGFNEHDAARYELLMQRRAAA